MKRSDQEKSSNDLKQEDADEQEIQDGEDADADADGAENEEAPHLRTNYLAKSKISEIFTGGRIAISSNEGKIKNRRRYIGFPQIEAKEKLERE